jgi:hypothetical protein
MRQFRSDPATVPTIRMDGAENRVDPDKWRPLIMSFCRFYGLGERVWDSTLSLISKTNSAGRKAETLNDYFATSFR